MSIGDRTARVRSAGGLGAPLREEVTVGDADEGTRGPAAARSWLVIRARLARTARRLGSTQAAGRRRRASSRRRAVDRDRDEDVVAAMGARWKATVSGPVVRVATSMRSSRHWRRASSACARSGRRARRRSRARCRGRRRRRQAAVPVATESPSETSRRVPSPEEGESRRLCRRRRRAPRGDRRRSGGRSRPARSVEHEPAPPTT